MCNKVKDVGKRLGGSLVSYFQSATHTPKTNLNAPTSFLEAPRGTLEASYG